MTASIPASAIVSVTPNVVSAGGTGLDLCGLFLTSSERVPMGAVVALTSAQAVADYFGPASAEYNAAVTYFNGSEGSPIKPGHVLFVQYPDAAVAAYLRGGDLSAMTLAALQAVTGTITLTVDGVEVTSADLDLSTAVSFSTAAQLIEDAIANFDAVVTADIAGTTMTVSAVTSGTLAVGQVIEGTGVTAGTKIVALGTGTGGVGTYDVDVSQTVASTTISAGPTTVEYDTVASAFVIRGGTPGDGHTITAATDAGATALKLTTAEGAVTSQGADAGVPGTAMDAVIAETQNFATFTTLSEPVTDDCVAFAAWASAQNARYVYVLWDTDNAATVVPDTTSAGALIEANDYGSTCPVYTKLNGVQVAAFLMGSVASIDFERTDGRTNLTFRTAAALQADVTSETIAANLQTNGYNYFGSYATANDEFRFFYPGSVTGPFLWLDSLVNEIWMTNAFQLALMGLLTNFTSIPYNAQGRALVEAALADPIDAAVNFGAIQAGVTLSNAQIAQINEAAGNTEAADTVQSVGWYLQVADASPAVRAERGSPPINFWYTDGQSVQKIALNSLEVQ